MAFWRRKRNGASDPLEDERLKLGYEMAKTLLGAQEGTVANLRTRASAILGVAAFVVTFSSSVGLLRSDATTKELIFPEWAAWTLLGMMLAQGGFVMGVLWPVKFNFGHPVGSVINPMASQVGLKPINRPLIEGMQANMKANAKVIRRMARLLQVAIVLLLLEVGILLIALISLE
ncbi:hypothetical protein AB0A69_06190 [Streptomyces sp. NPDC045431]|uniref:hypothetical protein n=1 Tax=Streptomyces sp. NPDC045431 TaxID=3155613 RepID=UPI0033FBD018